LRPLHADRLQIDHPRVLLIVRTTRYFIKQSVTIRPIPCVHARSQSCVCCNRLHALNRPTATSYRLPSVILKLVRPSQATFWRTPKLAANWKSTKRRLNLHTRHAPPPASF
jgi:hypothetical protein